MAADAQMKVLETIERTASCFSIAGLMFIFVTFVWSPNFRRPINRLVFYASWGNLLSNIATLMSISPTRMGGKSHLCQFQAFLIQMFVPADAYWNLAMALNVYLTLFRKYNAQQLKALEWRYHLFCYGVPFVIGFGLIFAESHERGKVYGDALLWCWISKKWDFLRVALLYAPAWVSILLSFTIYLIAGREIFRKRQQLRAFKDGSADSSFSSYKTTNVEITSSTAENPVPLENLANNFPLEGNNSRSGLDPYSTVTSKALDNRGSNSGKSYERYTVNIASSPIGHRRPSPHPHSSSGSFSGQTATQLQHGRAALDANTAAWGYTKVAILFFVSLLVTWVPSSVNRVYALVHPDKTNIPLAYVAGLVLSLMGFWNSVIYIFTSRAACKELFSGAASFRFWTRGGHPSSHIDEGDYLGERGSMTRQHQTRLSAAALGKDRTHVAVTPVLERGNSDRGGLPSPRTYSTLSRARVSFADEWERLEPEPERDTPMEGSQDGEEEGKRSRDAHVTAASVV